MNTTEMPSFGDMMDPIVGTHPEPQVEPHIIIDSNRQITVPDELRRIGVQFDHNIETVTFDCPRYWDGNDLSSMKVYINYMRKDGGVGSYHVENVTIDETDDTIMHFDWLISRNVTLIEGLITFLVCIKRVDANGNEEKHWNSEPCKTMFISEGLECEETILDQYPDVITQILTNLDTIENKSIKTITEPCHIAELEEGIYLVKGNWADEGGEVTLVNMDDTGTVVKDNYIYMTDGLLCVTFREVSESDGIYYGRVGFFAVGTGVWGDTALSFSNSHAIQGFLNLCVKMTEVPADAPEGFEADKWYSTNEGLLGEIGAIMSDIPASAITNKITEESTEFQIPSAKAVYDYVQSVMPPSAEEVEY